VPYSITEEEAVELTLAAASGRMDKGAVTAFFRQHLKIPEMRGRSIFDLK